MTIEEYEDQLSAHDWWHFMSDDPNVYATGAKDYERLSKLAESNEGFMKLFKQYKAKKNEFSN